MQLPGEGSDAVGINPDELGKLIGSISKKTTDKQGDARPKVADWSSKASQLGLDTAHLTSLKKHLSWSEDQLPMLRRRHSLALDQKKEEEDYTGGNGMVTAGATTLGHYKTQAAARKAAKKDAEAFKNGTMSLQDYMKKLADNQGDPDYAAQAIKTVGPDRLDSLRMDCGAYDPDNPKAGAYVLAYTIATGLRNGASLKDQDGRQPIRLLAPLAPLTTLPKDVLVDLGKQAMAPANSMYAKDVWTALSRDSAAATQFVHDNMDVIPPWMADNSDHHGNLPDDQAKLFARVLQAGTVPSGNADTKLAAQNTTDLIKYYSAHPKAHTHPEIQKVFAQDIQHYWDDVQTTLTDPAPAGHYGADHVSVSPDQWQRFIKESMRDPGASAFLMAYSKQQATNLADADPHNPEATHASGLLNGIFSHDATEVYEDLKKESSDKAKKWQDHVVTWLNYGIMTGVSIAANPSAIVSPVTQAVITQVTEFFADDLVHVKPGSGPRKPSIVSWQDEWKRSAHMAYTEKGGNKLGDPSGYAKHYCGGKPFLKGDGTLVDHPSTGQKEAYSAWLKDPEVAKAANHYFQQLDMGRLDGETGGN